VKNINGFRLAFMSATTDDYKLKEWDKAEIVGMISRTCSPLYSGVDVFLCNEWPRGILSNIRFALCLVGFTSNIRSYHQIFVLHFNNIVTTTNNNNKQFDGYSWNFNGGRSYGLRNHCQSFVGHRTSLRCILKMVVVAFCSVANFYQAL